MCFERAAVVAHAPAAAVDFDAFTQSGRRPVARTGRLASVLPVARTLAWGADAARVSEANRGQRPAPDQPTLAGAVSPPSRCATVHGRADGRDGFAGGLQRLQKKDTGAYTAVHAALGGRTLKTGQSRWFVGYKKHTLRLWLPTAHRSVTLVPLVSWLTPANVAEGGLLVPSLRWCRGHMGWWPGLVIADMGYLASESKQAAREQWQTAVVTKLRADMKLLPPYVTAERIECPHGARLEWWEYEPESAQQWFRVASEETLCRECWQAAACPRHFGYSVAAHETLFGLLPLASRATHRLLQQVRPWIEPAQSFEKNQLGLGAMFFNSLRLAWQMSLWADSAVLLRTMAWLDVPSEIHLLAPLMPRQMELDLSEEK